MCTKSIKLPPAAFVGFRTVYTYSQAMDALHLLLYQFYQSPTIGVPFYCMDFGGFDMVSSQNPLGVRVKEPTCECVALLC